jgi:hypothetical protein
MKLPGRNRLAILLAAIVLASSLLGAIHVTSASASTPPPVSQTHLIYATDYNTMVNLAASDAQHSNQYGDNEIIILDFGRPQRHTPSYDCCHQDYGTINFTQTTFDQDALIVAAAETYLTTWYNDTTTTPLLTIAMGTSNNNVCVNANESCSDDGAGAQWAAVANELHGWLNTHGMDWQIRAAAADDMEPGYECAFGTRKFVDAYNNNDSSSAPTFDYGSAETSSCWNAWDKPYVTFMGYHEYSTPECYLNAACQNWVTVQANAGTYHSGSHVYWDGLTCLYPYGADYDCPTAWNTFQSKQTTGGFGAYFGYQQWLTNY